MAHYNYLIVGGGMTAASAVEGIREIDKQGSIGMISEEKNPPYDRPPLTKGLWKGKPVEKIWRKVDQSGVDVCLDRSVESIDPQARCVTDNRGNIYTYDRLLLATGGSPRKLPFGSEDILYYRTFNDYQQLRDLANQNHKFAVIGGGFIGTEIAAALKMNGRDVVMIFPEDGICARIFPPDLVQSINEYYREKGVDVRPRKLIQGVERREDKLVLRTAEGEEIVVDNIVAGIGIQPNVRLAKESGIEVDNGILVDEFLRTSQPDIYAAGDVAYFYNPILDTRMRVEHEDNANTMGRIAGQNMAGHQVPYNHLPFFYSDLFDLGYEAVGELNPEMEVIADWQEPYRKGVIYYLKEGRVRGVLLWNVWDQVPAARELISEAGPFKAADLQGRLPQS